MKRRLILQPLRGQSVCQDTAGGRRTVFLRKAVGFTFAGTIHQFLRLWRDLLSEYHAVSDFLPLVKHRAFLSY